MRKPSTPTQVIIHSVEPPAFERAMPLVHPDDWKTRRVARLLAKSCIPNQWDKITARKALEVLCNRMNYSFREAWQLATTHYPLTLEEIERTIN